MCTILLILFGICQTVSLWITPGNAQGSEDIRLELNGLHIPNASVVNLGNIGEGENALHCITNLSSCCREFSHRFGQWYYPDGTQVPIENGGASYYRNRGYGGLVNLNFRGRGIIVTGMFRCEIPDAEYIPRTLFVYIANYGSLSINQTAAVVNNSIISYDDLPVESHLVCATSNASCCSLHPNLTPGILDGTDPSGIGSWKFPNGSYVLPLLSSDSFVITREPNQGVVNLLHRKVGQEVDGIWTCELPYNHGTINLYVGLYMGRNGALKLLHNITIELVEVGLPTFKFTCTIIGGPVTHTSWEKDGISLQYSITITDLEAAVYISSTNVTGIIHGRYNFSATNQHSNQPATSVLTISGIIAVYNGSLLTNNNLIMTSGFNNEEDIVCISDTLNVSSGGWYYPNGSMIKDTTHVNVHFGVERGPGVRRLFKTDMETVPEGIWTCTMPDQYGILQSLHIGLYPLGKGIITIQSEVEFAFITEDPPVFTLTCVTTGGPVTNVWWSLDGEQIISNNHFEQSQTLNNSLSGVYTNILTVSGRYLGRFVFNASNAHTTQPISSTYTVSATPIPPINITAVLVGVNGVSVSWQPPNTGPPVTKYQVEVISYRNVTVVNELTVLLENLEYGVTYSITVIAFSEFSSPKPLPINITIGIPDPVASLQTNVFVTAIEVVWNPPLEPHGNITHYEVVYTGGNVTGTTDVEGALTTTVLLKLLPNSTYSISVRPYSTAGPGKYVHTESKTLPVSIVQNLQTEVVGATRVNVSWNPVIFEHWEPLHYTFYYKAFSTDLYKYVDEHQKRIQPNNTSIIFNVRDLLPGIKHQFWLSTSIQVQGIEFESILSEMMELVFDEGPFQLLLSPLDYCANWSPSKSEKIEQHIQKSITIAVSRLCNCTYSTDFIRSGLFSCWNFPTEVTYRSTIIGTAEHNASHVISYLKSWIESEPVVLYEKLRLKVETKCPIELTSIDDPECLAIANSLPSDPTLITRDPRVIQCVQSCLYRNHGEAMCNLMP